MRIASVQKKLTANATQTTTTGDVEEPLELGVLLGLRDAQRQRDRRPEDHQLPAPQWTFDSRSDAMRTFSSRWVE